MVNPKVASFIQRATQFMQRLHNGQADPHEGTALRDEAKTLMQDFAPDSYEHNLLNLNQLSIKMALNMQYGSIAPETDSYNRITQVAQERLKI
jgi:hypothetical protein